ncbi:hypothetical protein [Azonexus hydrophilus]|uniref:hypothetical protein n=1 Tax=Azonexus hydrophilus TaxID=418702 RepID=UPI0019659BA6|nr:hypothetical protein [Azonexus hydrophilus]
MKNWILPAIIAITLAATIATAYYIIRKIKQDKIDNHNTTATKLKLIAILIMYLVSVTSTWVEVRLFKDIDGFDPSIFPIIAMSVSIIIFYVLKKEIGRKALIISGAASILISLLLLLALANLPLLSNGPGVFIFAIASALQMYVAVKYRPKNPQPFEIRITI